MPLQRHRFSELALELVARRLRRGELEPVDLELAVGRARGRRVHADLRRGEPAEVGRGAVVGPRDPVSRVRRLDRGAVGLQPQVPRGRERRRQGGRRRAEGGRGVVELLERLELAPAAPDHAGLDEALVGVVDHQARVVVVRRRVPVGTDRRRPRTRGRQRLVHDVAQARRPAMDVEVLRHDVEAAAGDVEVGGVLAGHGPLGPVQRGADEVVVARATRDRGRWHRS